MDGDPTPLLGMWILTVKEVLAALARLPRLQVSVPAELVHEIELLTNDTPKGRVSVTTALVRSMGRYW